ncbi:hypothetical protein [Sphingomonas sp.]
MSIGRSTVGGEAVAGSGEGSQVLRKPPSKRTVFALADRTTVPEPR